MSRIRGAWNRREHLPNMKKIVKFIDFDASLNKPAEHEAEKKFSNNLQEKTNEKKIKIRKKRRCHGRGNSQS